MIFKNLITFATVDERRSYANSLSHRGVKVIYSLKLFVYSSFHKATP